MANSEAMKTLLSDDVARQNRRPMTALNRTNQTQPKRRPMTAHHCHKGMFAMLFSESNGR